VEGTNSADLFEILIHQKFLNPEEAKSTHQLEADYP
jgi:hypothetical protein